MSAVLPLSQSSRDLIIQVARSLEPRFAQITEEWRNRVGQEFGFDPRTLAALKRMTIATGCSFFCQGDFASFFENVTYFGSRLAKLEVDTRAVSRTLEIYNELCEPHLEASFGERLPQAQAALQMLNSATFVALSGAYFDSKSSETHALLALSDAELAATDVSTLLRTTLEVVTAKFGATIGALMLKNAESDVLGLEAALGMDLEDYGLTIPVGQGFSGRIVQSGEPLLALDASLEEQVLSPTLRRDAKTLWGVPVRTTAGVLGALVLGFDKPFYEWLPRERQLLEAMAARAGAGLERARMTEALREREATIARLSGHLLTAQEEERKRISRELHAETGQALMVIRL